MTDRGLDALRPGEVEDDASALQVCRSGYCFLVMHTQENMFFYKYQWLGCFHLLFS